MDVFFILLTIFSFILAKTTTLNHVCEEASCSMKPKGACTITCQTGILATRLPDGPLRELPGTVRELTLLVDNSVKGTDPTVVVGWVSPREVLVREYEVYLMTWDNAVPPLESAALPHRYLVNTSHPTPQQQMTLRVTSSWFRGMNDITVYINTWVGDRHTCHLRQAKTTFYTMASIEPTSTRWHYYPTMSLSSNDVINVTFTSFPGADLHDLELCKIDDVTALESCKAITLYEPVRTALFGIDNITCRHYRLSIIPDPNPNNEVIEVKVFIPDLNCSVCKDDTWPLSHQLPLTEQSTNHLRSTVKKTLPVQTVILIVVASFVGLIIGIVFVVMTIRRHQQLKSTTGIKMDSSCQANNGQNREHIKSDYTHKYADKTEDLQRQFVKRVFIVYSEDSPCHQKVVMDFATYLARRNFRLDIRLVTCSDIMSQATSGADVTVVVSSDIMFQLVQESNQRSRGYNRTPHFVDDLKEIAMTRTFIIVRFDYTKSHLPLFCDKVSTFNLPADFETFLCAIDECQYEGFSLADCDLQDLMTSIQGAITCHDKVGFGAGGCACHLKEDTDGTSCVTWIQHYHREQVEEDSNADDVMGDLLPPTPISEYDSILSVNQQLTEINRCTQMDY